MRRHHLTMRRHVLSNVSSVTARDSSRAIANSQDLFTALCEDDAIYGTFKTMKGMFQNLFRRLGDTLGMSEKGF